MNWEEGMGKSLGKMNFDMKTCRRASVSIFLT